MGHVGVGWVGGSCRGGWGGVGGHVGWGGWIM